MDLCRNPCCLWLFYVRLMTIQPKSLFTSTVVYSVDQDRAEQNMHFGKTLPFCIYYLTSDKILAVSKMKIFVASNFNIAQIVQFAIIGLKRLWNAKMFGDFF